MAGRTTLPVACRALFGILLALVLGLTPGLTPTATAVATPSVANSSTSGPELHEDLRSARDLPRPATPRPERPVVGRAPTTPVHHARGIALGPASTPAEALPLPLDLLPINRN
jgi:hypothetical protein